MRKSVKVIIAAAVTGSLALGAVSLSSFATSPDVSEDSGIVWSKNPENGDDLWSYSWEGEDNEELSAFERELLEEISRGSELSGADDVPSVTASDTTLKEVKDDGSRGFKLWTSTIQVSDISEYANSYIGPDRFTCATNYKTGKMTGKSNYEGSYKKVHTRIVFRESDRDTGKNQYAEGTAETVSATVQYTGSGRPVEAAYYFYIYDGTGSGSKITEAAVVYVVDRAYAASAEYAQKSYADILDVCTYVDV